MFDDVNYIALINIAGTFRTMTIRYMSMIDFTTEYMNRMKEMPRIVSLISITDEEFEHISDLIDHEQFIFDGETE